MTDNDALVSDYLSRLEAAASGLPADRRAELIEEISAHIAEAMAQSSASIAGSGADLLDLLGRLGDPQDIARAAADAPVLVPEQATMRHAGLSASGTVLPPVAGPPRASLTAEADPATAEWDGPAIASTSMAGPAGASTAGATAGITSPGRTGLGALEVVAVVLSIGSVVVLPVLPALAVVGWLVGIVLLWYSPRWQTSDKILGTLVWPVGIGLAILLRYLPLIGAGQATFRPGTFYGLLRLAEVVAAITAVIVVAVRLLRRAAGHVT